MRVAPVRYWSAPPAALSAFMRSKIPRATQPRTRAARRGFWSISSRKVSRSRVRRTESTKARPVVLWGESSRRAASPRPWPA